MNEVETLPRRVALNDEASVTAALIDSRRRRSVESEQDVAQRLEEVTEQLARIESSLARATPRESAHDAK